MHAGLGPVYVALKRASSSPSAHGPLFFGEKTKTMLGALFAPSVTHLLPVAQH